MRQDFVESVRLDGVDLAYRVVGDGPELVVLLHHVVSGAHAPI